MSWVCFRRVPKINALSGFVWVRFRGSTPKSKRLSGSVLVRFGFVFHVNLLITLHILASLARFGAFLFAPRPQFPSRQIASVAMLQHAPLPCGRNRPAIALHRHRPKPPRLIRSQALWANTPFEARLWPGPSASENPKGNYTSGVLSVK